MMRFVLAFAFGSLASFTAIAVEPLKKKEWKVNDVTREGLVHAPAKAEKEPCPLVFVFHGHGGTAKHAATKRRFTNTGRRRSAFTRRG